MENTETVASQFAERIKDSAPLAECQTLELDQASPWSLYPSDSSAPAMFFFVPPDGGVVYQVSVRQVADPQLLAILG